MARLNSLSTGLREGGRERGGREGGREGGNAGVYIVFECTTVHILYTCTCTYMIPGGQQKMDQDG